MERTKRNPINWIFFCFIIVLMAAFLGTAASSSERVPLDIEGTASLNEGWSYTNERGEKRPVALPTQLPAQPDRPVAIRCNLPENLSNPAVLCFRSVQQSVRVLLDGEEIYAFGTDPSIRPFGRSPGSAWNLVRLPENEAGSVLTIELTAPYETFSGRFREVLVGTQASLVFHLERQLIPAFFFALVILLLGVVLLTVYFGFEQRYHIGYSSLYLGGFALLMSVWLLCETQSTQFFSGNPFFWNCASFLSMLSFPIPLIRFVGRLEGFAYRRVTDACCTILYLQIAVSCTLQFFNVFDFMEMLPILIVVLMGASGVTILALAVGWRRNRNSLPVLASLLCLYGAVLLEVAWDWATQLEKLGVFIRLGVLAFLILQAVDAIRKAARVVQLSKCATLDALTGCQNRTAYLAKTEGQKPRPGMAAVMCDLNDLKQINDSLGHESGDEAISSCATALKHVFEGLGDCYRIGGDEFLFLGEALEEEQLHTLVESLQNTCREASAACLQMAVGYALYNPAEDQSIADMIRRADHAMYHNKEQMKREAPPIRSL